MKPIILLALVAVAAGATGVGFLNTNIMLTVQNLGVGSEDLETPISNANVDLSIAIMEGIDLNGDSVFKNVVDSCSFHYPENANFPGLDNSNQGSATVICKLSKDGLVVAEGSITQPTFAASKTYDIKISKFAYEGSNLVNNVNDLTLVVLGNDPTP